MKKFVLLLFATFFPLLTFPNAVLAATLSLSPASGTFNSGCPFTLSIILDTLGAKTDGTDAILIYDSSRFAISTSSIAPNTSVYPDFPGNNVDEAAGKITISGLGSVNTPYSAKGTLASLNFTVKDAAPAGATQIKFEFDPADKQKTTDSNVVERDTIRDVLNEVVDGNYTIGTGTCGTTTTLPGTGTNGRGAVGTPSATPVTQALPPAGTQQLTYTFAIVGSVLTVLGILGIVLL